VVKEIGEGLKRTTSYHVVVLRSTVFPGTTRSILLPALEQHSGREAGRDFGLAMNPEFLREANAVADFHSPAFTVVGEIDERAGDAVELLYGKVDAPVYRVPLEEAEMLKLVCNSFHAVKIGFANEIGRLCDKLGLDSHRVMDMMCLDTKLNISKAYLKPGYAFGGSCLPKDLRSLVFHARRLGAEVPLLDSILVTNHLQVKAALVKIHEMGPKRVTILGLSFKPGTDDLRESPVIALIRDLWQDGVDVVVHDPDVNPSEMLGSNREYLERQLPQIDRILCSDLATAMSGSQVIVVTQKRPEYEVALRLLDPLATVLDLVRLAPTHTGVTASNYRGISW
jgi:GDP-mannose 6-dehydrogenase